MNCTIAPDSGKRFQKVIVDSPDSDRQAIARSGRAG